MKKLPGGKNVRCDLRVHGIVTNSSGQPLAWHVCAMLRKLRRYSGSERKISASDMCTCTMEDTSTSGGWAVPRKAATNALPRHTSRASPVTPASGASKRA